MTRRRFRLFAVFALALAVGTLPFALGAQSPSATFAARLNDQEFWKLVGELSEANGSFRSDNLLSNEARLQYVIPELQRISKPGGAYIGVGPEQNFTLIAALKPAVAFIVDIRRGNLDLQLLYKAVFEMSADRADFVGRLFSRARPTTLRPKSSVGDIFAAYSRAEPSETLFNDNLKAVDSLLTSKHGYALSADDLKGIEYVYNAFFTYGPAIQYSSSDGFGGGGEPSYVDIMVATDATGRQRGFLASDEAYAAVKDLEARNLVVPVVGDFAGPKAIRGVGKYVRDRNGIVSAFYVSNVEQYLRLFRNWGVFCANAQTLPGDETSVLIRAGRGGRVARGNTMTAEMVPMVNEMQACGNARF
jgi:hypothetical protein